MTHSLSRKLILVFSAILLMVIALNTMINALLLEKVYRSRKISAMKELYDIIEGQYSDNASEDDIKSIVSEVLSYENLRVYIWDGDNNIIITSLPISPSNENEKNNNEKNAEAERAPREETSRESATGNGLEEGLRRFPRQAPSEERNRSLPSAAFIFDAHIAPNDNIYECDDYSIVMFEDFNSLGQKSLYLRGNLPENRRIVIQMPIAPISESAAISNTLMLAVGIIMLVIGILIVSVTSRTIARPVKELSEIADSMQNLDFSRKYTGKSRDEIGSLGASINSLSAKLEETINELYEKNEQLEKDIELKSRIDTMRKEFIANASHELKTPVALISGYAEGLRDNVASDEESRRIYTDVIIDETERMDHIIHQMLDLMELDNAQEMLKNEKISLAALTEDAINACSLLARNKGVTIECMNVGDTNVYGDYWRIYQAVINYITNAVNHVDEKGIIKVSIEEEGSNVRFSVYNSGKNIPEEEINNIWERFYKVDKAHTRAYGGTGLGLSIVRSVIELHGGEYGVINKPEGVEFYFVISKEKLT